MCQVTEIFFHNLLQKMIKREDNIKAIILGLWKLKYVLKNCADGGGREGKNRKVMKKTDEKWWIPRISWYFFGNNLSEENRKEERLRNLSLHMFLGKVTCTREETGWEKVRNLLVKTIKRLNPIKWVVGITLVVRNLHICRRWQRFVLILFCFSVIILTKRKKLYENHIYFEMHHKEPIREHFFQEWCTTWRENKTDLQ